MVRTQVSIAILAMGMGAVMAVPQPSSAAGYDHANQDTVLLACTRSGLADAVCQCIDREVHSRFTHQQLDIIGRAMPELERIGEPTESLQAGPPDGWLSSSQLEQLRQRAETADVVIRQACGVGLRLGD